MNYMQEHWRTLVIFNDARCGYITFTASGTVTYEGANQNISNLVSVYANSYINDKNYEKIEDVKIGNDFLDYLKSQYGIAEKNINFTGMSSSIEFDTKESQKLQQCTGNNEVPTEEEKTTSTTTTAITTTRPSEFETTTKESYTIAEGEHDPMPSDSSSIYNYVAYGIFAIALIALLVVIIVRNKDSKDPGLQDNPYGPDVNDDISTITEEPAKEEVVEETKEETPAEEVEMPKEAEENEEDKADEEDR